MIAWCVVFFFKQKTAYEMRISDWSSDVCSSDLLPYRPMMTKQARWNAKIVPDMFPSRDSQPRETSDGRRADFLYQPDVARTDRPLDARRGRRALSAAPARFRPDDEGRRLSGDPPDGQDARHPPQRQRRHRLSRDLPLSGRTLSPPRRPHR